MLTVKVSADSSDPSILERLETQRKALARESGKSLINATALVVRTALENGAERAFENYASRGAGIYAYDVVECGPKS
jgi:hypothetical protein